MESFKAVVLATLNSLMTLETAKRNLREMKSNGIFIQKVFTKGYGRPDYYFYPDAYRILRNETAMYLELWGLIKVFQTKRIGNIYHKFYEVSKKGYKLLTKKEGIA